MTTLAHGVRYTADLGYRWELDGPSRHKEFNLLYLPMASRSQEERDWMPEVGRGRVTALVECATPDVLPEGLDAEEVQSRYPPGSTGGLPLRQPRHDRRCQECAHRQGIRRDLYGRVLVNSFKSCACGMWSSSLWAS